MPERVQHQEGHVTEYVYDASGVKRKVRHYTVNRNMALGWTEKRELSPSDILSTLETEYTGNKIYENGVLKMILTDEGYVTRENGVYKHHYYIRDYLGNNRLVVDGSGNVEQKNYYYPFGLPNTYGTAQENQPYKFNGKELDRMMGMNWYDYSARFYDGATGRFTTQDPLAEKYYSISPYAYCNNNPVNAVDPNGEDVYFMNEDGEVILALKADEEVDKLFALNSNQNKINSITVSDRNLLPQLSSNPEREYDGHYGVTSNSDDAFNVFKFAADNTNVEWGLNGYETEDGNQYLLRTSNENKKIHTTDGSFSEYDMSFTVHSHTDADYEGASGYGRIPNTNKVELRGDMLAIHSKYTRFEQSPNWSKFPDHYVYRANTKTLYNYTHQYNKDIKFGRMKNAFQLQNIIRK